MKVDIDKIFILNNEGNELILEAKYYTEKYKKKFYRKTGKNLYTFREGQEIYDIIYSFLHNGDNYSKNIKEWQGLLDIIKQYITNKK